MVMNKHRPDSYVFENKTWKEVIYVAGALKYSEQMNRHRGEPKYTEQSLNISRKDKSSKAKVQKRSWVELKCVTENVNIFCLYCLWCKGKYPKEKKNPTVAWKFVHIIIIFKLSWIKEWEDRSQKVGTIHFKFPEHCKESCDELYI